jgi:hypothetical protein
MLRPRAVLALDLSTTINERQRDITHPVPIFSYGQATLYLEQSADENAQLQVVGAGADSIAFPSAIGGAYSVLKHMTYQFQVMSDPNMHAIEVWQGGNKILGHYLAGPGPGRVVGTPTTGRTHLSSWPTSRHRDNTWSACAGVCSEGAEDPQFRRAAFE